MGGFVFGTLLGPEATGPGVAALVVVSGFCLFLVSWLQRAHTAGVWGVWFGVVV